MAYYCANTVLLPEIDNARNNKRNNKNSSVLVSVISNGK